MKLSRKTDYALRVLLTLVQEDGQRPISIRELADRNDVPKRFLEQIMLEMKQQGWVRSVAGSRGGYLLARPADKITMGQVIRHFDGLLAPIACVSVTHHEPCSQESTCRFRRVLLNVRNHVAAAMDRASLDEVAGNQPVTREEVFNDKLVDGAGI